MFRSAPVGAGTPGVGWDMEAAGVVVASALVVGVLSKISCTGVASPACWVPLEVAGVNGV